MLIIILVCIAAACWFWARPVHAPPPPSKLSHRGRDEINLINEAIAAGRKVSFRYEKADGTITWRTVTPRELRRLAIPELQRLVGVDVTIRKEGRLCMFGHCHLRGADRVFAIDRIQDLRLDELDDRASVLECPTNPTAARCYREPARGSHRTASPRTRWPLPASREKLLASFTIRPPSPLRAGQHTSSNHNSNWRAGRVRCYPALDNPLLVILRAILRDEKARLPRSQGRGRQLSRSWTVTRPACWVYMHNVIPALIVVR
jgi:hypothetical protein